VTLRRHIRDITVFKVVTFTNYDSDESDQLSVWTLQALIIVEHCFKNRLRTLGKEAFGVTLPLSENCE